MKPDDSQIDDKLRALFNSDARNVSFSQADFSRKLIQRIEKDKVAFGQNISILNALLLSAFIGLLYFLPQSMPSLTQMFGEFSDYLNENSQTMTIVTFILFGLVLKIQDQRNSIT